MHVSELTDSREIYEAEKRLHEFADSLADMVKEYGKARQIREFDGDRRKRALAVAMTGFLDQDESAAAAEAKARASYAYGEAMKTLGTELRTAETIIATWQATQAQFEAARSILSAQKEMSRM